MQENGEHSVIENKHANDNACQEFISHLVFDIYLS